MANKSCRRAMGLVRGDRREHWFGSEGEYGVVESGTAEVHLRQVRQPEGLCFSLQKSLHVTDGIVIIRMGER